MAFNSNKFTGETFVLIKKLFMKSKIHELLKKTNMNASKKLFLIASLLMALTGMTFAQTTPKKAHTKKDGTADMRYKANKDSAPKAKTAPSTTHLKKDGTPDKRFKENKTPAKKS